MRDHQVFSRIGADLTAEISITLSEALCGFSRVVLTHLDGRGILLKHLRGKLLKPGELLKIKGEGMPHKKGEAHGDLYLQVTVAFPDDDWLSNPANLDALAGLLPRADEQPGPEYVDEMKFERDANLKDVGLGTRGPNEGGSRWTHQNEEDEGAGGWFGFG